MRIDFSGVVTTICLVLYGAVILAEPERASQQCSRESLPANIEVSGHLARALQHIHDRSPTFRTQCERVGAARHLRVRIRLNSNIPSLCRAYTVVRRTGRLLDAEMHLPFGNDRIELVAHEFEHLLEQIEGLNMRRLSRVRGSGVREVQREMFESDRATAAGRVVAAEVRRGAPAAD